MIQTENQNLYPDVISLIPQRAPFLFVDKILNFEGEKIETTLHLSGEENYFKGHFPGNPIMPGVLQQEALFQTGAILIALRSSESKGDLGVVVKVENARFKNFIKPGDTLFMTVTLKSELMNAVAMSGKIVVNGKTVSSVDFTCMTVKKGSV